MDIILGSFFEDLLASRCRFAVLAGCSGWVSIPSPRLCRVFVGSSRGSKSRGTEITLGRASEGLSTSGAFRGPPGPPVRSSRTLGVKWPKLHKIPNCLGEVSRWGSGGGELNSVKQCASNVRVKFRVRAPVTHAGLSSTSKQGSYEAF